MANAEARAADMPLLPDDALYEVLLSLGDVADVARFSLVSKYWYRTIHSDSFWNMQPACSRRVLCQLDLDNSEFTWADLPTSSNANCLWRPFREHQNVNFQELIASRKNYPNSNIPECILVRFSHGLLCTHNQYSDVFRVFNPFKSSAPIDVLVPPKDVMDRHSILSYSFHFDLLTKSYVVILTVGRFEIRGIYHLVIYQSSTSGWSRSKPVKAFFDSWGQTCIGDSMYVLDCADFFICKYNIAEDSWSKKKIHTKEMIREEQLAQIKGQVLFVGRIENEFCVWIPHEMKTSIALIKLISITVSDSPWFRADSFLPVDDVLLVTLDDGLVIYHASTNSLQLLDCPECVAHCFIAETKGFFFSGTENMHNHLNCQTLAF